MKLIFVDTETLSLGRAPVPWEVAYILATQDGGALSVEVEVEFFTRIGSDLTDADPMSLQMNAYFDRYRYPALKSDHESARRFAHHCVGRLWVGACPDFDDRVLWGWAQENSMALAHDHHLIDVSVLAAGHLKADPPLRLKDACELLGVERSAHGAHTALGDAWDALNVYAAVYGLEVR